MLIKLHAFAHAAARITRTCPPACPPINLSAPRLLLLLLMQELVSGLQPRGEEARAAALLPAVSAAGMSAAQRTRLQQALSGCALPVVGGLYTPADAAALAGDKLRCGPGCVREYGGLRVCVLGERGCWCEGVLGGCGSGCGCVLGGVLRGMGVGVGVC